jgi:IS605 OrfB family transposase
MRKTFQYRLYPTSKQEKKFNETLEECRWLYNHLLEKRKEAYKLTGKGLTLYGQQATFPILKQERSSLTEVHSQILQNVAVRVDLAFKAYFRRVREHAEEPGFPQRIAWRRENFTHQTSRKIVNSYGVICVEDLRVNQMTHNHCLSKSIHDTSWSAFFSQLACKAEEAGRLYMAVNPAYTSQVCSRCHHRQVMPLSERLYHCPCCLLSIDRDLNAALNIRAVGLHSLGLALEAPAFRHGE